jgi:hypothetical protein
MSYLVQLPPVIVRSSNIQNVNDALKDLFGVDCVKECSFEEQNIAYVKFLPMQSNTCLEFFNKLSGSVTFIYNGTRYVVDSQYINI